MRFSVLAFSVLAAAVVAVSLPSRSSSGAPPEDPSDGVRLLDPGAEPRQVLRYHLDAGSEQRAEATVLIEPGAGVEDRDPQEFTFALLAVVLAGETEDRVVVETTMELRTAPDDFGDHDEPLVDRRAFLPSGFEPAAVVPSPEATFGTGFGPLIISVPLPREPVGPGARWVAVRRARYAGVLLREELTFKLRMIGIDSIGEREDLIYLAVEIRQTLDPSRGAQTLPGGGEVVGFAGVGRGALIVDPRGPLAPFGSASCTTKIVSRVRVGGEEHLLRYTQKAECSHGSPYGAPVRGRRTWKEQLADLAGYDPAAFDSEVKETWPRTLLQALAVILRGLDEESRELIRSQEESDLGRFHHGWGMGIRNSLGLWRGNDALLRACGEMHPDGASGVIIHAVWEALREGP